MTPTAYGDVTLLPQVEKVAQQGLAYFKGAVVSSRARSEARNQEAGGADDSSHKYRVAFDFQLPESRWAEATAFFQQRGARVLPERFPKNPGRNHLHVDYPHLKGSPLPGRAKPAPTAAKPMPRPLGAGGSLQVVPDEDDTP